MLFFDDRVSGSCLWGHTRTSGYSHSAWNFVRPRSRWWKIQFEDKKQSKWEDWSSVLFSAR